MIKAKVKITTTVNVELPVDSFEDITEENMCMAESKEIVLRVIEPDNEILEKKGMYLNFILRKGILFQASTGLN